MHDMSRDVFVFIEQRDGELQKVGIELLGKSKELAETLGQKVVAMLVGANIKSKAETLIHHGADKVIVIENEMLQEYVTEPYAKAIYTIIKKYSPEIVLYGASSIGRDLAPRLAARLHTGLTADCTALEIDENTRHLMMTRPAFGGNLMATILCENHRPQMATVRPGVMKALDADMKAQGEIIEENVEFTETDMNIVLKEVIKRESKRKDITEAAVLVSGGRGIGAPENFNLLQELADLLGAEVSASRATVDAGWISKDRQVGQTGKTVRPQAYFALGISGAIQHLAGMEESECIIAVNRDEEAPIFKIADLGIVGDVNTVIPKLIECLKKEKQEKEKINGVYF